MHAADAPLKKICIIFTRKKDAAQVDDTFQQLELGRCVEFFSVTCTTNLIRNTLWCVKCAWAFVTFINLCTCTRLPFWGKVGAVQTMWLNLWIRDQVVQPHDKKSLQTKVVSLLLQKCNFRSFAISCLSNLYEHMVAILGKSRSSANYVT